MTRPEAMALIAGLPPHTIEAIAMVVETADAQGDYMYKSVEEGSIWEDDAQRTLSHLASEIRRLAPPA